VPYENETFIETRGIKKELANIFITTSFYFYTNGSEYLRVVLSSSRTDTDDIEFIEKEAHDQLKKEITELELLLKGEVK